MSRLSKRTYHWFIGICRLKKQSNLIRQSPTVCVIYICISVFCQLSRWFLKVLFIFLFPLFPYEVMQLVSIHSGCLTVGSSLIASGVFHPEVHTGSGLGLCFCSCTACRKTKPKQKPKKHLQITIILEYYVFNYSN